LIIFPSQAINDPKYHVTFAYNNYLTVSISYAFLTLEGPLSEPLHPDVTLPDIDVVTGFYGLRFDKNSS
jgi:hypothetical protein